MMFGHFINERHYPFLGSDINPYRDYDIAVECLGEYQPHYFELGETSTVEGIRLGYGAMAADRLQLVSEQSSDTIHGWSLDSIFDPTLHSNFIFGVGLSLFCAHATYAEMMLDQGRQEGLYKDDTFTKHHRGDNTSI